MRPDKLVREALDWVTKNARDSDRPETLAVAYVIASVGDRVADELIEIRKRLTDLVKAQH